MLKSVLFFVFLFFVSSGFAQKFKGGTTAGLVGSQIAGDTYSGYNKAGIFAGAFVQLSLGGNSSMQMELTYFQKGSRENPDEKNNYNFYLFRANYIELPLLYQYNFGRFIVEAGPSAGFLTGFYQEDVHSNTNSNTSNMAKITIQANLGIVFQATESWHFMIRTNNSLMNIQSKDASGDIRRFWDYGKYNDSLVLGIRYVI